MLGGKGGTPMSTGRRWRPQPVARGARIRELRARWDRGAATPAEERELAELVRQLMPDSRTELERDPCSRD